MTTPLTKEERGHLSADYLSFAYLRRYEATVRAVEAERDALAERVEALRKALIQIDNVTGLVQDKHSARDCRWISSKALREDGEAHRRLAGDAPPLPGDGPPMPHPVAVAFLEALRRDFARDPDSVIALLAADDAERGVG